MADLIAEPADTSSADEAGPVGAALPTAQRLLAGAATLFSTKGYAATSTRELSAMVGIRNASLYHHVGGKEDLLYQLCMSTLDSVESVFAQVTSTACTDLERLELFARSYVELALQDRAEHSTMLTELRSLSDDRRSEVVAHRDRNVDLVRAQVARAQDTGAVRSDVPAKYLTLALFNLLNWSIFWFRPDGELDPAQLSELLWSIFEHGVGGAPLPDGR